MRLVVRRGAILSRDMQRRGAAILKVYKGAYSNVRMAKFGIALDFGSRGRGFESRFNFTAPCFYE